MKETEEHIKTRMLKNAARIWGYPETDAENSFDPLVGMLMAACSVELEKISCDIHSSRARVLEKLMKLLSPDTLTGPLPAHAIACATPVENRAQVQEDTQFYIPGRRATGNENEHAIKDMFFSPTASFVLNKAAIRYIAAGTRLFSIGQNMEKETVAHSAGSAELPASTLWLGINEPGVSLHETVFYFGFRDDLKKKLFYHGLSHATWYAGFARLQHRTGYGKKEISGETLNLKDLLHNEHAVKDKINKEVNAFYKPQFITLLDETHLTKAKSSCVPDVIRSCFKSKDLENLQQPLRWISIRFPETISGNMLEDAVCAMNCFPVVNRRLHQLQYRMQEIINIIPLETEDLFLDIDAIHDDSNNAIPEHAMPQGKEVPLAMLMRNGGVGRFDERDAAAVIDHVLQLLKDESAAFSTLNHDFISTEMKQLRQTINKLEQKLLSKQTPRDTTPYLIVHNNNENLSPHIFINYWSTHGKQANHIKAGTALQLYRGTPVINNQVQLITNTVGGRDKLSTTESILAYKSAFLSRDRIITLEDIKAFCHYQLGDGVKEIKIRKGIDIYPGEQQGYTATLDVLISLHTKAYEELVKKGDCGFWEARLVQLLEEKSAALIPYRVIIQAA